MAKKPAKQAKPSEGGAIAPADIKRWPALNTKLVPVAKLLPYARNSHMHTDQDVDDIARAIAEFGWTVPVLIDEDGTLLAGHARVLAARKLRLAQVPAARADGWSPEHKKAYVIWDNESTKRGTWNEPLLKVELGDLKMVGFDLTLTGLATDRQVALLNLSGETTPPGQFQEVGENLPTDFCCPRCRYVWSGNPLAGKAQDEGAKSPKPNGKGKKDAAVAGDKKGSQRRARADKPRRGAAAGAHG